MDQWTSVISKHFPDTKVGNLGGGIDDIEPITVSTYDSAYLRASVLGNKFALMIFDEAHHPAHQAQNNCGTVCVPFSSGIDCHNRKRGCVA